MDPFQVWLPAMATHTKSIAGGHWWAIENPITAHDLKSVYMKSVYKTDFKSWAVMGFSIVHQCPRAIDFVCVAMAGSHTWKGSIAEILVAKSTNAEKCTLFDWLAYLSHSGKLSSCKAATLAAKTFRLLPPWRILLKRFFEPCYDVLRLRSIPRRTLCFKHIFGCFRNALGSIFLFLTSVDLRFIWLSNKKKRIKIRPQTAKITVWLYTHPLRQDPPPWGYFSHLWS